jgi:hypothetical protein
MKTAWTRTSILLAGALVALVAAMWILRMVAVQAAVPRMLQAAQQTFQERGGAQGLADRQRMLTEIHAGLERQRAAMSSDAELFNRRLGEVFDELGLVVTTSSGWRTLPGFANERAAGFERALTGSGAFGDLLDAIGTIESWPDQARVRFLQVVPEGPGSVSFSLDIAVVRLAPSAGEGES